MKSAYELAMERLEQEDPDAVRFLTEEQKQRLSEIEEDFKTRKAEREVFLQGKLEEARASGDADSVRQLERQLADERERIEEEKEAAKEKVRNG